MPETLAERLHTLVVAPGTQELVTTFYDPSRAFAGSLFDNLGVNPRNLIITDDLLAVTLLDVGFRPPAVRALLTQGASQGELSRLLGAVPSSRDLWDATNDDLARASDVWAFIREQSGKGIMAGVGSTHRSKLLARKRPRLVPIVDSVVRSALTPLLGQDEWVSLREALREHPELRTAIESLRPLDGAEKVTVLRLLDSAIWMWCSSGRGAKRARTGMAHPLGRSVVGCP